MPRIEIESLCKELSNKFETMMRQMSICCADSSIPNTSIDLVYCRLTCISKKWEEDERSVTELLADICVGLHSIGASLSVVFRSEGGELSVFVGSERENLHPLLGMINGTFRRSDMQCKVGSGNTPAEFSFRDIVGMTDYSNGGFLVGNPDCSGTYISPNLIDNVIKGMGSNVWITAVFARPLERVETIELHKEWQIEASACSELGQISYTTTDSRESMTINKHYYQSESYFDKVDKFCKKLLEGVNTGEWCVTVNFASDNEISARLLGGLLTSAYYGKKSEPEAIHTVFQNGAFRFLFYGDIHTHSAYLGGKYPYPKYGTLLNNTELGVLCSFPTKDCCGFSVLEQVDFDISRVVEGDLKIGKIMNGSEATRAEYSLDINELNRHVLVCGLTGSGKTNTVKSIIKRISIMGGSSIPFTIIEPAKSEYWELYKLGFDNLQIYSIGSAEPGAHPYCINPFERIKVYDSISNRYKTVSLQTHIDYIFAAFKASFIMYTPMPYVLESAIYSIYEDLGWDVKTDTNKYGSEEYPTIEDLYDKIPEIVTSMGYDQKMRSDLTGSLQARINSLRLGSKGDTLNVGRSFPPEKIFGGNTVIELEEIGDDDVKAFVISLLLIQLMEFRRQQEDSQLEIKHIMLIEEAHRLLKNVSSGTGENADPRGAAVEFFCNLLAEMRSKGQGFIIADQIPSKLAPDLIKNTNTKIMHRTVASEDRELMGGAMHMTDEQKDSLSLLPRGVAAIYSEGDNHPKLVNPPYAGNFTVEAHKNMRREDVLSATDTNCVLIKGSPEYKSLTGRSMFCKNCDRSCRTSHTDMLSYFDPVDFDLFAESTDPKKTGTFVKNRIDQCVHMFIIEKVLRVPPVPEDKAVRCVIACLLDKWQMSEKDPKLLSRICAVYRRKRGTDDGQT